MAHNLRQLDHTHIPPELVGVTKTITPKEFERLCRKYRDLRLELTSTGELIVMPPTGSQTGRRNSNLTYQLEAWARNDGTGVCFGAAAGFALPNNARRSPDASWVRRERWDRLTDRQKDGLAPICPDFVVELRSRTDRLTLLLDKMSEYMANGASLGWLVDPGTRRVYVYKPHEEVIVLENAEIVSGEPLMPGFKLITAELW